MTFPLIVFSSQTNKPKKPKNVVDYISFLILLAVDDSIVARSLNFDQTNTGANNIRFTGFLVSLCFTTWKSTWTALLIKLRQKAKLSPSTWGNFLIWCVRCAFLLYEEENEYHILCEEISYGEWKAHFLPLNSTIGIIHLNLHLLKLQKPKNAVNTHRLDTVEGEKNSSIAKC